MPRPDDELLLQRLQADGERVTWVINSMVYTLEGVRYIVCSNPIGGWGVAQLPAEYGPDHYDAAVRFLWDVREGFKT